MTVSAAALLGVAFLYFLLCNGKKWKNYMAIICGMIPAGGLYAYQKWFYMIHAGDIITKSNLEPFNMDAFILSLQNLPELFWDTFGLGKMAVFIMASAVVVMCIYFGKKREWRKLILTLVSATGCLFALSFGWMEVYEDECILFGKSRMVIFWVFLILELIMIFSFENKERDNEKKTIMIIIAFSFVCLGIKVYLYTGEINDANSTIYKNGVIRMMSVDNLKQQAEIITDLAESIQADVLITSAYSRVMAYGASALNYDKPMIYYVPDRDRRVWVYNELRLKTRNRILMYSMPVDENVELSVIDTGEKSVIEYFKEQYGITRGGEYGWGMR